MAQSNCASNIHIPSFARSYSSPNNDEAKDFRKGFGLEDNEMWDPDEFDLEKANYWAREV